MAKRAARIGDEMNEHNLKGNCISDEAYRLHEDVCPKHDEPRGECSECQECEVCEAGYGQ
jgi:hypothetical protein